MRIAAVTLAVAAAYLGVLWYRLGAVLDAGGRLEDRANASVVALSAEIQAFQGDPKSGTALLPKLTDGRMQIARVGSDAADVGDALLPPFGSAGEAYRTSLRSYATHVDDYYATLSRIGTFVVGRGDVMEQLSEGLQVLGKLATPGTKDDDVRRVIKEARTAVDTSADQLRSLSESGTGEVGVYSNDALLARLDALSGLLGNIVDGLDKRDSKLVQAGTQGFSKLMQADWQALFFAADDDGLKRFGTALSTLNTDRQSISAARQDIAEKRAALGAAAIGLVVIALFTAAVAWLR